MFGEIYSLPLKELLFSNQIVLEFLDPNPQEKAEYNLNLK